MGEYTFSMDLMLGLPPFSPLLDRVSQAWRKVRAATRVVALTIPTWIGGQRPTYFDRTYENYVKEGYKKNELIYAAINATANTAASVALRVHDKANGEELKDHPLRKLIERPNPLLSEYDFWYTTIIVLKLSGICYWEKQRNQTSDVIGLWPVRPDWVAPIRTQNKGIESYQISIGGVDVGQVAAENMIVFRLPDPLDLLFGHTSPIEVLARVADVDNSLTDFLKMFMERGATPPAVLTTKATKLRDEQVADIRRRWAERYSGALNWLVPAVLDNDVTYQRIGLTFKEMEFSGIDSRDEARIFMVLQVPPIIVGALVGLMRSTFSNYGEARRAWWEDVLKALYKKLADVINAMLAPDFGDGIEARWDFSDVPALQEEVNRRWDRATHAWDAGLITRNMALEEIGKENVGAEGDVFKLSMADVSLPDDRTDNTPAGVKPVGTRKPPQEDDEPAEEQEDKAAEPVKPKGEPLTGDEATEVAPFTEDEIDDMFDLYQKLVGSEEE